MSVIITNTKTGETETIGCEELYNNILNICGKGGKGTSNDPPWAPQRRSEKAWGPAEMLFFRISNHRNIYHKSNMTEFMNYLNPSKELFMRILKDNKHPLHQLTDYPEKYDLPDEYHRAYYITTADEGEIFLAQFLDKIKIEYVE